LSFRCGPACAHIAVLTAWGSSVTSVVIAAAGGLVAVIVSSVNVASIRFFLALVFRGGVCDGEMWG
jgi:hypothetical protein